MTGHAVTADGSPVEVYRQLPAEPDLSVVRRLIGDRRSVLDLGAGAGRIAEPLALAGHDVTAVDDSAEMLAGIQHARTVVSRIEDVDLGERYDVVLMLSHLVNAPDEERGAFLDVAARHLASDGIVIIQRHDPERRLQAGRATIGPVEIELADVDDSAWPFVRATTTYRLGDEQWRQEWTAEILDDTAIEESLATHGLTPVTLEATWVTARPATANFVAEARPQR